jgi:uncharacterized Zn-finger protein
LIIIAVLVIVFVIMVKSSVKTRKSPSNGGHPRGKYVPPRSSETAKGKSEPKVLDWLDQETAPQSPPRNVACPHCGVAIIHHPSLAGRVVACPQCSKTFQLP